ncbi:TPA: hypothetical protein ACGD7U_003944 [Serratia marcescens]|uniref:hypothetical protein n=1 Tax=Serratia TaxID=613 RepID=UPI0018D62614|nr:MULTISPECIES: hypothetical protein [Serratia]MBH2685215.1 hypothetical protein [Serratia ureilytica]UAN29723.1 hypothetical protein KGP23_07735 [Serratia ureilytica]
MICISGSGIWKGNMRVTTPDNETVSNKINMVKNVSIVNLCGFNFSRRYQTVFLHAAPQAGSSGKAEQRPRRPLSIKKAQLSKAGLRPRLPV